MSAHVKRIRADAFVYQPGHTADTPLTSRQKVALGDMASGTLLTMATDLVIAVREEDRAELTARLHELTRWECDALLVVLAAMVPLDQAIADLLAWVDFDEHGRPLYPALKEAS